VQQFFI